MPYRPGAPGNNGGFAVTSRAGVTNVNIDEEMDGGSTNLLSSLRIAASVRPELTDFDPDQFATVDSSAIPHDFMTTSERPNDIAQNAKPNFTSRRRQSSIPKIPMGPRPLDIPAGKRYATAPAMLRSTRTDLPC